jgi:hypothetical protein
LIQSTNRNCSGWGIVGLAVQRTMMMNMVKYTRAISLQKSTMTSLFIQPKFDHNLPPINFCPRNQRNWLKVPQRLLILDEFQQLWKDSYIFENLEYPLTGTFSRIELLESLSQAHISVLAKSGDHEKTFKLYVYCYGYNTDYYLMEILIDFDSQSGKLKVKSNHDIDDFIVYFEQQMTKFIKI